VQIDAPHNYNLASREAMYAFFGKHLLGETDGEALKEQPFEPETNEDLLVFSGRELPDDAWTEAELTEHLIEASEAQLEAARPRDEKSLRRFREVYGSSLAHALNLLPAERLATHEVDQAVLATEPYYVERFTLAGESPDLRIPATLVAPATPKGRTPTLVIAGDRSRATLLDEAGHAPGPLVKALVDAGRQVLLIDPFLVGDNQLSPDSDRRPEDKFFDTYNRTDLALRVQDIVAALLYAPSRAGGGAISLIGQGDAGLWCLLASAAGLKVQAVAADLAGFDATSDDAYLQRLYTPQLRRAGDLRTAAALWAPSRLLLHNAEPGTTAEFAAEAYRAVDTPRRLSTQAEAASTDEIVDWITEG
jgi:hypothetical protein